MIKFYRDSQNYKNGEGYDETISFKRLYTIYLLKYSNDARKQLIQDILNRNQNDFELTRVFEQLININSVSRPHDLFDQIVDEVLKSDGSSNSNLKSFDKKYFNKLKKSNLINSYNYSKCLEIIDEKLPSNQSFIKKVKKIFINKEKNYESTYSDNQNDEEGRNLEKDIKAYDDSKLIKVREDSESENMEIKDESRRNSKRKRNSKSRKK